MNARHSLLVRQLKRHAPDLDSLPDSWQPFIDSVDAAYREFDLDRAMLERSLDLSSQELLQSAAEMRKARDELERRVEERTAALFRANLDLTAEIGERKRFEDQLVYMASHDPLTGLLNRRQLESEIERHLRLAEQDAAPGAVLFLDLDQFKDVNDSFGHRAGDELLQGLAELLRCSLREEDVLARSSGDEFAIFLPHATPRMVNATAERIETAIRQNSFLLEKRFVNITASIGIALYPAHGVTAEELLANADVAMYQAKARGRGRVEIFRTSNDWRSAGEARLTWRNRIAEGLEHDRFVLYAQPIHSLKRPGPDDYELLLRLPVAPGQLATPVAFMSVAEDFGLVQGIDRWVVTQAVRLLAQQERNGLPVRLAINVSAKSLGDSDLLALIKSQLATTGVDPSALGIELTETAAISNLSRAQRFVNTLKTLGCRTALDDFGVGFSSFFHLKHLPVDYLKIDGAFVRNLARDELDQHLVRAIVAVAGGLGKETIAEFVRDEATVELLRQYGVDYAQGYHIGRPRAVHDVLLDVASQRVA